MMSKNLVCLEYGFVKSSRISCFRGENELHSMSIANFQELMKRQLIITYVFFYGMCQRIRNADWYRQENRVSTQEIFRDSGYLTYSNRISIDASNGAVGNSNSNTR